jgi:hypothetical protein
MIGVAARRVTFGAVVRGAVLVAGFFAGADLLGVVLCAVVLVVVVLVVVVEELVVEDLVVEELVVLVVVVVLEPPAEGPAVPPVGWSARATGADSASAATASARCGSICLGEVIKTMPVGAAPQMVWNTPESVTSRLRRCPHRS